jgi:hypothetical protein
MVKLNFKPKIICTYQERECTYEKIIFTLKEFLYINSNYDFLIIMIIINIIIIIIINLYFTIIIFKMTAYNLDLQNNLIIIVYKPINIIYFQNILKIN